MKETTQDHRITRRGILHVGSAALAGVAALTVAGAQDKKQAESFVRSQAYTRPSCEICTA